RPREGDEPGSAARGSEARGSAAPGSRADAVLASCLRMRGPLFVATVIALVSVAPVFVLDGLAGSFLRPVALAYLAAILASLAIALTVAPALAGTLLRSPAREHRESPVGAFLERRYAALVPTLVRRP